MAADIDINKDDTENIHEGERKHHHHHHHHHPHSQESSSTAQSESAILTKKPPVLQSLIELYSTTATGVFSPQKEVTTPPGVLKSTLSKADERPGNMNASHHQEDLNNPHSSASLLSSSHESIYRTILNEPSNFPTKVTDIGATEYPNYKLEIIADTSHEASQLTGADISSPDNEVGTKGFVNYHHAKSGYPATDIVKVIDESPAKHEITGQVVEDTLSEDELLLVVYNPITKKMSPKTHDPKPVTVTLTTHGPKPVTTTRSMELPKTEVDNNEGDPDFSGSPHDTLISLSTEKHKPVEDMRYSFMPHEVQKTTQTSNPRVFTQTTGRIIKTLLPKDVHAKHGGFSSTESNEHKLHVMMTSVNQPQTTISLPVEKQLKYTEVTTSHISSEVISSATPTSHPTHDSIKTVYSVPIHVTRDKHTTEEMNYVAAKTQPVAVEDEPVKDTKPPPAANSSLSVNDASQPHLVFWEVDFIEEHERDTRVDSHTTLSLLTNKDSDVTTSKTSKQTIHTTQHLNTQTSGRLDSTVIVGPKNVSKLISSDLANKEHHTTTTQIPKAGYQSTPNIKVQQKLKPTVQMILPMKTYQTTPLNPESEPKREPESTAKYMPSATASKTHEPVTEKEGGQVVIGDMSAATSSPKNVTSTTFRHTPKATTKELLVSVTSNKPTPMPVEDTHLSYLDLSQPLQYTIQTSSVMEDKDLRITSSQKRPSSSTELSIPDVKPKPDSTTEFQPEPSKESTVKPMTRSSDEMELNHIPTTNKQQEAAPGTDPKPKPEPQPTPWFKPSLTDPTANYHTSEQVVEHSKSDKVFSSKSVPPSSTKGEARPYPVSKPTTSGRLSVPTSTESKEESENAGVYQVFSGQFRIVGIEEEEASYTSDLKDPNSSVYQTYSDMVCTQVSLKPT